MICTDVEILMYTFCSSVSVLAPLFARKSMDRRVPSNSPVIVDIKNGSSGSKESDGSKSNYVGQVSPIVSKKNKKPLNSIFGWSQAMNDTVVDNKEEDIVPLGQHPSNVSEESRQTDLESGLAHKP